MKLEFLDDISDGGKYPWADPDQLVRLYDFDKTQASLFRKSIENIILEKGKTIDLKDLSFIQPINCSLQLRISNVDEGITTDDKKKFICNLTIKAYKEMVELIEPFTKNKLEGYQWLYDIDTPIDFLFSPGGTW